MNLDLDDAQRAIADAVAAFCRDRCPDSVVKDAMGGFPHELWRELAALGVLELGARGAGAGEGGALELVAALEALGRAVFPGPLAATCFATRVLAAVDREAVASGEAIVAVGAPPLLPWAPVATLFIEVDGERAWQARPRGAVESLDTLGGEPWGRVALERAAELDGVADALAHYDLALAAYLAAAGERLVADASDHARTRTQFGRPIGDFQAVAHPLADCSMALGAAAVLARSAAFDLDTGAPGARARAAAARLSARRAAVATAHVAHQVFGAVGVTLEGPVFHVTRRIRQLGAQPPGEARSRGAVLAAFGI